MTGYGFHPHAQREFTNAIQYYLEKTLNSRAISSLRLMRGYRPYKLTRKLGDF